MLIFSCFILSRMGGYQMVNVTIITEGAYPHVIGGLSTWVHRFLNWCDKHFPKLSFEIYSIINKEKNTLVYEVPSNVKRHHIYVMPPNSDMYKKGEKPDIEYFCSLIENLLNGYELNLESIGIEKYKLMYFLKSKKLFDLMTAIYEERYSTLPFKDFYWTFMNAVTPILGILFYARPNGSEIFHSTSVGLAGLVGVIGKVLYNKNLIVSEHGFYMKELDIRLKNIREEWREIYRNIYLSLVKTVYKYADIVTAVTPVHRKYQMKLGLDTNKSIVILNGTDLKEFNPKICNNSSPTVGYVGRLDPIKGIHRIIRVASKVLSQIDTKFIIAGPVTDEEYYKHCLILIDELKLKEKITIIPRYVKSLDIYSEIGVFINLSYSEGLPFALIEAAACGIPVVCLENGGSTLFNDAGFVCKNEEEVVEKLVKLIRNEKLRKELSQKARRLAERWFNEDFSFYKYIELYHDLVTRKEPYITFTHGKQVTALFNKTH